MSLLVSTKIYTTRPGAAARVARDWRVVMVPDSDNTVDVLGLYNGISSHAFDELEPYVAIEGDQSIRAQVGRLETGPSQDIPLSVKLADAANAFGIYFKFFVRPEDASFGEGQGDQGTAETPRDN